MVCSCSSDTHHVHKYIIATLHLMLPPLCITQERSIPGVEDVEEPAGMQVQSSWSTESTLGSTATSLDMRTLETASFTLYKNVDPERIEYTPEEMRCNDWMMQIEGEALERVQQEAIDAHSAALQ